MKGVRGEVTVIVIVVLALLGGVAIWKPSWIPGASRRAAKSTEATAAVEKATAAVDKSVSAQGAAAAAIGVEIGVANGLAPDSPSKSFIGRELPLLSSLLPPPDQKALIAAQQRRIAVMEGNLEEARRLYDANSKEVVRLQKERDAAIAARAQEQAARRAADVELEKAAAAEHAKRMQMWGIGLIALLFLGGWIYTRVYSITPDSMGRIVADIRSGHNAIESIDANLGPRLHPRVRKASKLATEPK